MKNTYMHSTHKVKFEISHHQLKVFERLKSKIALLTPLGFTTLFELSVQKRIGTDLN